MANFPFEQLLQSLQYKAQSPQRTMGYAVEASKSIGDVSRQKSMVGIQQQQEQEQLKQEKIKQLSDQIFKRLAAGEKVYNPDGSEFKGDTYDFASNPTKYQGMGLKTMRPELTPEQAKGMGLVPTRATSEGDITYEPPMSNEGKPSGMDPGSAGYFRNAGQLRGEFDKATKDFNQIIGQLGKIDSAMEQVKKIGDMGSKQFADQSLIVTFNRILDPQSVVRESEYARTPEGMSAITRIQGYAEKLKQGGAGLTDSERQSAVDMTRKLAASAQKIYKSNRDKYATLSRDYGIDPKLVISQDLSRKDLDEESTPDLKQQAISALQEAGAPATEANIKEAMRQLGGK